MAEEHYEEYKKQIAMRDEHKQKAKERRARASKLPVLGALDEWFAKRHEAKAEKHEAKAFESAEKHADAIKKKRKL